MWPLVQLILPVATEVQDLNWDVSRFHLWNLKSGMESPRAPYLDSIRAAMKGIPGAEISVDQEQGGPPTEPPINIEIASENFDDLIKTAVSLRIIWIPFRCRVWKN